MKQNLTVSLKLIRPKLKTFGKNLSELMKILHLQKLVKKLVNGQKLG
jgi:hypothetical protein